MKNTEQTEQSHSVEVNVAELAMVAKEETLRCLTEQGFLSAEQAKEFSAKYFFVSVTEDGKVRFRYAMFVT